MSHSLVYSKNGVRLIIGVLVLFHIIGTAIMLFYPEGASLSYMNLLLCGFLLFISESNYVKTTATLLVIFVGGFLVEFIGVHTGLLFGNYGYGAALGPKFETIPIVIGINWFCVVLASCSIIYSFKINILLKSILAGALCTGMDYLIEPVAMKLDFWDWENGIIPIWNYVCWFGFATFFSFVYLKFSRTKNKPAQALFFIWIVFFSVLNFAL